MGAFRDIDLMFLLLAGLDVYKIEPSKNSNFEKSGRIRFFHIIVQLIK